jgi:hypothetical protein
MMLLGQARYPPRLFLAQIVETSFSLPMFGVRSAERRSNHFHAHTAGSSLSRMPIPANIAERRKTKRRSCEEESMNFDLPVSPGTIWRHIG